MRRLLSRVVLLTCCLAGTARADDAAVAEAQARFKEGLGLAERAKFDEARIKFLQAYAVVKAASVTYNLALAEQKTGHDVEAIGHFRAFLVVGANDTRVTDSMRERARANIAELSKRVALVAVEAPEGAKLTVDGAAVDVPREPIAVTAGKHVVEGSWGGRTKSAPVDAKVGETAAVKLVFDEPAATASPAPAWEAAPASGPPPARWSTARIATVGGLGAGAAAGVVLAVVFHGKAGDKVDEARSVLGGKSCVGVTGDARCDTAASLKSDRDTADTLSTVSVVAAGVLGAGAVAAAVFWPKARHTVGSTIVPEVSPGYGGMKLLGHF